MSTTPTTPAVAVAEAAPATNLISTDAEYRKTGVKPEAPKPAESAPAQEYSESDDTADVVVADESAAASEAAHQEQKPKRNAETRIRELVAQKNRLEAQLEEARRPKETTKTAESSPAEKAPEQPKQGAAPKKPDAKDFDKYDDYEAAKDKYFEDLADYRASEAVKKADLERQQREVLRSFEQKLADARKLHADYDEVAKPVIEELVKPEIHQAVKTMLDASPVMTELYYAIGASDKKQDFLDTAKSDPIAAIRKLVLLEQLVMNAGKETSADAPAKTTPKPPPPPPEVSGKGTPPGDEYEDARKAADGSPERTRKYMDVANRRDVERAKGGRR